MCQKKHKRFTKFFQDVTVSGVSFANGTSFVAGSKYLNDSNSWVSMLEDCYFFFVTDGEAK